MAFISLAVLSRLNSFCLLWCDPARLGQVREKEKGTMPSPRLNSADGGEVSDPSPRSSITSGEGPEVEPSQLHRPPWLP